MKKIDAMIVGAGPAGSAAAIALARRGYQVALIDKQMFPREKLCGDFINPINRPILRDLGIEEQVLSRAHGTVTGFRITTSSGRAAEVEFAGGARRAETGIGLRRADFDRILVQRAAESGAAVHQGQRITELRRLAYGWLAVAEKESWQAKLLIGADGRNSWVARQLGADRGVATTGRAVGFQCRLRISGSVGNDIEIHLFPGGYAGLVGIGDGMATLGIAVDRRWLNGGRDAEVIFERVLGRNPRLKTILRHYDDTVGLRSVYPVYFPSRRAANDHALLVGDAARVSEPITGEGIYLALRSGLLAADALDTALQRGDLSASGLAGYEHACRSAFRSRLALNSLLRFAVYRPALLEPLVGFSARHERILHSLVSAVCVP